jgi:hypothetical protein
MTCEDLHSRGSSSVKRKRFDTYIVWSRKAVEVLVSGKILVRYLVGCGMQVKMFGPLPSSQPTSPDVDLSISSLP